MSQSIKVPSSDAKALAGKYGEAALEGVAVGTMLAYFYDLPPMGYVAAAFAAGAASVGLKIAREWRLPSPSVSEKAVEAPVAPIRPAPETSALVARIEAMQARSPEGRMRSARAGLETDGRVAERHGGKWLVYASPDAEPVVMPEREYARHRRSVRNLVEIETTWEGTKVSRLYLGRLDSSLTGLPAVEVHDEDGKVASSEWYVEGRHSSEDEALEAHRELAGDSGPKP